MDGLLNQQMAVVRSTGAQLAVAPAAVAVSTMSTCENLARRCQWGMLMLLGIVCSGGCQILSPGGMTVIDRVPAALHEYPAGSRVRVQVYESPIPGGRGSNRGTYEGVVAASSPEQITLQNATHDRWMPNSLVMISSVPVLGRYLSAGGRPTRTFEAAVTIEVDRVDGIELLKPADGKTVETLLKTRLESESAATGRMPSAGDEPATSSRDVNEPFADTTHSEMDSAVHSEDHDGEDQTVHSSARGNTVDKTASRFGKSSRGASTGAMSTGANSTGANSTTATDDTIESDDANEPY